MATRLSFLLWNGPPDDLLLDAAGRGDLYTDAGLNAEALSACSMTRAPRVALQEFFAQYLDLARLDHVSRDPARWPMFSPTMTASMRTEVQLLVDDLIHRNDGDIRQLFSTRRTFVNAELAALYDVAAEGASPITFVPVELPRTARAPASSPLGAFLTMNAHETITSPTNRAASTCASASSARSSRRRPATSTPTSATTRTWTPRPCARSSSSTRRTRCAPAVTRSSTSPGFLFEHFDSVGGYRTLDNGYPGRRQRQPRRQCRWTARATSPRRSRPTRASVAASSTSCTATPPAACPRCPRTPPSRRSSSASSRPTTASSKLLLDLVVREAFRTVAEETDA